MKSLAKLVSGFAVLFLAACSGGTGPVVDDYRVATIQGVVRDAFDWTPIAGATVETSPATSRVVSDDRGRFAIQVLAGETYTITASRLGFETASVQVIATISTPSTFIDVPLVDPIKRGPAGAWDLGVRATPLDFASQTLTFQVEIRNTSATAVPNVVVSNQLDAAFGPMTRDDIEIDAAAFPDAVVIMGPDGRSFSVWAGAVGPTSFVRLFRARARLIQTGGVFCSRASIQGTGQLPQGNAACVTWAI